MIAPNTLLQNRYLVLNQIGQGGMGSVYIATDQRFGSTVALKETAFFNEMSMRKAFEREARLLNHLRHPALPRVSDHFTEEDGQFLVMEYIAGDDLAEKLKARGSAFPVNEVLNWADQLLDALDYLHTQEPPVIHRDIKPQNLKLTPRNHIVLLDFGLAKGTPAVQMSKMTATGSVFGYSRYYASLEQIQGAGTDPRSDLYSLGATLYHLITGVIPPDALTRATAVLNGQPDPLRPANEVHEQVTPAVAEVINNAMAQNASHRPQTASAMREALREAARQSHSVVRETSASPASSSNVYEQDTQLMYAAASPATTTGEDANKTDAGKALGATNAKAATSTGAATSSTKTADSVITKVATTPQNPKRKAALGIAASAVVASALAAGVYTYTRQTTPTQTPAVSNESIQSPSPTPQAGSISNSNSQPETVVIIKKGEQETSNSPTRHTNAPPVKHTQETAPPVPVPREENEPPVTETHPPVPPDVNPNEPGAPRRPPLRRPQPGDPNFDEEIRMAIQRKLALEEARRAAQEQRRTQLLKQRAIIEERRRRRQMQQP